MNLVEPIRDPNMVRDISNYLKDNSARNYIMFMTGIYSGLRISDILKLRIEDVRNKSYINLRETKTRKQRIFPINPILKKVLYDYIKNKDPDDYLIKSRQGYNKAISRVMAYNILRKAGEMFGLESIGTHTLRKTFGYHFYKQTGDIATLQQILNHSHPAITLRYIGINQESINNAINKFKI